MRSICAVFLLCAYALLGASAWAATLDVSVQDLQNGFYRFEYQLSGHDFLENQELEVLFSPGDFLSLSSPVAPAGFDAIVFQPGNPLGAAGRFSALALADHVSVAGGFSVDVRLAGSAQGLGAALEAARGQPFFINQLDGQFVVLSRLDSGLVAANVPEPATSLLLSAALLGAGAWRRRRHCP